MPPCEILSKIFPTLSLFDRLRILILFMNNKDKSQEEEIDKELEEWAKAVEPEIDEHVKRFLEKIKIYQSKHQNGTDYVLTEENEKNKS